MLAIESHLLFINIVLRVHAGDLVLPYFVHFFLEIRSHIFGHISFCWFDCIGLQAVEERNVVQMMSIFAKSLVVNLKLFFQVLIILWKNVVFKIFTC